MNRRIFEAIVDEWPQDRVVIRVNWARVAFALLPVTMILVALAFKAGQAIPSAPSAATEVPSAPKAESTLQLVAEPTSQGTDSHSQLIPLGIFVHGPSELASVATVEIIGLPRGALLTAGRPLGDRWRIPAARLSGAAILPPRRYSGEVDLGVELRLADDTLVERRSVRWTMIDPDLATEETVLPLSKTERDRSGVRLVPAAEADNGQVLLGGAERLFAQGDISSARVYLVRAAKAGNAQAALLLGETYDECLLSPSHCGRDADRATARTWYEIAANLGSAEARQRLDRLAGGDRPSR